MVSQVWNTGNVKYNAICKFIVITGEKNGKKIECAYRILKWKYTIKDIS